MNKITGVDKPGQVAGRQNIQKPADPKRFQKALQGAIDAKSTPAAQAVPKAGPLGEIQSVNPSVPHDAAVSYGNRAEKLLDRLDQYTRDLGDPGKTLRDLAPTVDALKRHADELLASASSGERPDESLREIAERSAVMANVEYIKFYRGDYL